ncbi:hypothetical protein [Saccharothrix lopnurensis]|uniref:Uncharacterized protein n=1 Tax=Saccharothrix lopnurensis TaxID=1670621 RepID=A0ABW1P3X9_9PSEU
MGANPVGGDDGGLARRMRRRFGGGVDPWLAGLPSLAAWCRVYAAFYPDHPAVRRA